MIYDYIPDKDLIREQATMEYPGFPLVVGFPVTDEFEQAHKDYDKHITSLKTFPVNNK